ncbi:MAG: MarC family protein [Bacteroidales bacterium]|nr:MarC family protein [Bacteroidales bacterium]
MHTVNFVEIFSAFLVMFAIIDITGSLPIFLSMRSQNKAIKPLQATLVALALFVVFFYVGDAVLRLFGIDAPSFAVAGAAVLFILSLEMITGHEFIKNEASSMGASIVPVAFPLIAGPGAITALISLRAEYADINIMIGLLLNIVIDYLVIKHLDRLNRWLGSDVIYVFRKFFGVVLLAIAVKLLAGNISIVFSGQ